MNRRAKLELKSLLTPTRFMQAWEHVRQCGPSPGIDDIGFNEFERDLKQHIEQLVQELESGQYQPDAVRRCEILQLSGKVRPLAIPTVRDRLLLRLLSEALTPLIEPRLKQGCFAFRPGRSAVQAAAEVSARIRDGWVHVARFDISSFFDSIPRDLVYGSIKKLNIDGAFFQLLAQLIETPVFGPAGYEDAGGLHQGSALSPLLSNLVLTPFDGIMEEIPIIYIRYCDDIICLARDPATLIRATETARAELSRLQLQFNEKKFWTGLADEGFVFLGFQFNADGRGPANRAIETVMTRFGQILSAAPAAAGIGSQLAQCLRSWGVYYGCNAADFLDSSQPIVLLAQYLAAETVGERESVRESLLTLDTPESKTETRCLAELAGILFTDFPVLAALTFYNALTGPETPGLARLAGIPAQTRQLGKNYGSSASIEDLANALDGLGQFDWAQACERAAAFLYFVEREDEGEELDGEELDGEELDDEKLDDEKLAGSELNGDEVEAGHVDRVMEQTAKKATRANSAHKNSGATADRSQLEQFRQIFQGAEAQFLQITAATEAQGSIQWQHHMRPISLSDVQAHLSGEAGIAVVPLRSDGRVRIAVIDIDVSKQAILNNNNIVDPEDYSVAHKDAIQ